MFHSTLAVLLCLIVVVVVMAYVASTKPLMSQQYESLMKNPNLTGYGPMANALSVWLE